MRNDEPLLALTARAAEAGPVEVDRVLVELQLMCGEVRARFNRVSQLQSTGYIAADDVLLLFIRSEVGAYEAAVLAWKQRREALRMQNAPPGDVAAAAAAGAGGAKPAPGRRFRNMAEGRMNQ